MVRFISYLIFIGLLCCIGQTYAQTVEKTTVTTTVPVPAPAIPEASGPKAARVGADV